MTAAKSTNWLALAQLATYRGGSPVGPKIFGEALWGAALRNPRTNRLRRQPLVSLHKAVGKVLSRLHAEGYAEWVPYKRPDGRRDWGWQITEDGRSALRAREAKRIRPMGSDLYISINVQHDDGGHRDPKVWSSLWEGPSDGLARGVIVDAFGDCDDRECDPRPGYLSGAEVQRMQEHPECPWRLDEPYWVRLLDGQEFVAIVQERRWQSLQDGDFSDLECGPELRGFAAMVAALFAEGVRVRVWCWHSQ